VPHDTAANWLTNTVSESLNKILKKGFSPAGEQEVPFRTKLKIKKVAAAPSENDNSGSAESNDFPDSEPDSESELLGLIT